MKLIIEDDEGRRTVVPLVRDELSIGRHADNVVRLSEKNVSRRHAKLVRQDGRFFIEDLASFTGVRVNGERIVGKRVVDEGDLIQISEYDLILQAAPHENRPPPLEDEDAVITGPIPTDGAAKAERNAETSVIRMENVAGSGQTKPRELGPAERPRLVVSEGALRGREFSVSRSPVAIGRTSDNDVAIEDSSVSRYHCKLFLDGDTWKLLDNRSAHGVKVNGERYAACRVRYGDALEIGKIKLRFLAPGASAAAVAPAAKGAASSRLAAAAPAAARRRRSANRALFGLGVIAVLAVAAAVIVVPRARKLAAPSPAAPDDGAEVVAVKQDVIQAELGKARAALVAHKLGEAVRHFEAAGRAGATAEELGPMKGAQAEQRDEQALQKLDAAIAARHFDDAKAQLEALGARPGYFADQMRARAEAVRKAFVEDHLARAEAIRADSVETCAAEAQLALGADPQSARGKQLLAECSKPKTVAAARPAAPAPSAAAAHSASAPSRAAASAPARQPAAPAATSADSSEQAEPEVEEPSGRRARASRQLEARVQAEPDVAPTVPRRAEGDANAQARALAAEGNQKLLAKDFDAAIALFQQALDLKPSEPVLARLYRSLGIALTEQGNVEEGAHYYRLYLPLCTDPKEREYLRTTLEEYEARRR